MSSDTDHEGKLMSDFEIFRQIMRRKVKAKYPILRKNSVHLAMLKVDSSYRKPNLQMQRLR
jgi:hypothetical protein